MDASKAAVLEKRVQRTLESLRNNNMWACYVPDKEQARNKVAELLHEGDVVACGGSMSLFEAGIIDLVRQPQYRFLDRYAPGLTREQIEEIYIDAFRADVYLTSANAVTETGALYNVDGNSNRVAAILYGPRSVVVVAGVNKLVRDIDEAVQRVRETAAPANAIRLDCKTPCVKSGRCMDCSGDNRICCSYVVSAKQRKKDRMKVILVGEELGY